MAELLKALSQALVETVAAAEAGVVRVDARRRRGASGIVWSADGVIVTASHVVERDHDIQIGLVGGKSASATLLGRDNSTDLAVLRSDVRGLAAPDWAEPEPLAAGGLVLALGRPADQSLATLATIPAPDEPCTTP